uniref:Uncharacterized protein n=1 Tax=Anguilla anguilla TaxID=7936 RepID=A0A0E9RNI1_ANGAN
MAEILLVDKGTVDRFQLLFAAKPCCQLEDCHIFSPLNGKHIVHVSFSCESHFFGGTRAAMFMSCQMCEMGVFFCGRQICQPNTLTLIQHRSHPLQQPAKPSSLTPLPQH